MKKPKKTDETKVAIACQGGGSQTAFTAGVLKSLFDNNIHHQRKIIGLTGTSGGALNAALAWYGLLKTAKGDTTPIGKRIADFWHDLMAQHSLELFVDQSFAESLRLIDAGLLPLFEISPASFISQWMTSTVSRFMPRERFMNFKGLLEDHIKFEEIESLREPTSPVLLIGAANVLKGNMKIFNSRNGEITAEAILASAAIPNLFPAVQIGEDYYWDGLFSANPPVMALVQAKQYKGEGNFPDEIWIILINALTYKNVPTRPNEIVDRRNEMIGNVSVIQEVNTLMMLGRIFKAKGFKKAMLKELGYTNPEWVKIRFIHMTEEIQSSLDYPSKLSRDPSHINKLIEDGEKQGQEFLKTLSQPADTIEEAVRKLRQGE